MALEMEEIVKILIIVVVLVILVWGVVFLFQGKGGAVFDSIRNLMRFGK